VSPAATRDDETTPGQVITFYSYKGGTGRSMALANAACLIAQGAGGDYNTLMVDWDLEAPGLHKYFPHRAGGLPMADSATPGLIELCTLLDQETQPFAHLPDAEREARVREAVEAIDLGAYTTATDVPGLFLMKAGTLDQDYAANVNQLRWDEFYQRAPWAMVHLVARLADRFRYVLVDSRTGLTDTSGICTTLLPEKLVVVFTPNAQSMEGVTDLMARAIEHRQSTDDLRPLVVYPLPARIENLAPDERDAWRTGNESRGLPGWQRVFERALTKTYGLTKCDLSSYFNEVQIRHHPYYAYGEKVAVRIETGEEIDSMPKSYERFVDWLVNRASPWEDPQLAAAAADARRGAALGRKADRILSALSEDERAIARRVFLRLTKILGEKEVGEYGRQMVPMGDFAPNVDAAAHVIDQFCAAGILVSEAESAESEIAVQIVDPALIAGWARLRTWIATDRAFLVWRQSLAQMIAEWNRLSQDQMALLRGKSLDEAVTWLASRADDLNSAETNFIVASRDHASAPDRVYPADVRDRSPLSKEMSGRTRVARMAGALVLGAALIIGAAIAWNAFTHSDHAYAVVAVASTTKDPAEAALLLATLDTRDGPVALARAREVARERLPFAILGGHVGAITSVSVSPDRRRVLTTSQDGIAKLSLADGTGRARVVFRGPVALVNASFSSDGAMIVVLNAGGSVFVLSDTSAKVESPDWFPGETTDSVATTPAITAGFRGKSTLMVVDRRGNLSVWTRKGTWKQSRGESPLGPVRSAVFSTDGSSLATEYPGQGVSVWDPVWPRKLRTLSDSIGAGQLALSADGSFIGTVAIDGTMRVRDQLGQIIMTRGTRAMTLLALDPFGAHVALGGASGSVVVFGTRNTRADSVVLAAPGVTGAIGFAPDSSVLVTGSDSIVRLWRPFAAVTVDTTRWESLLTYFGSAIKACLGYGVRMRALREEAPEAITQYIHCNSLLGRHTDTTLPEPRPATRDTGGRTSTLPPSDSALSPRGGRTTPPPPRDTTLRMDSAPRINRRIVDALQGQHQWSGRWDRGDGTVVKISLDLRTDGSVVSGSVSWDAPPTGAGQSRQSKERIEGLFDMTRLEFQLRIKSPLESPMDMRLLVADEALSLRGSVIANNGTRGTLTATITTVR
jgi:WD40 repeat protein/cellulose biosynthesis protein BcsQ